MSWSLRRRLTVAIAAAVALALVGLAVAVLVVLERAAWRQFDGGLRQRAEAWTALIEHDDDGYEMELPTPAPGARAIFVEAWCPAGVPLARSANLGDADLPQLAAGRARAVTLPDGRAGRALALRFTARDESAAPAPPCLLVLAEGTEDVTAAIGTARTWFAGLGALALALTLAIATWLIGRGLRPLDELSESLAQIDGDSLATRIALRDPPRELAAPIARLNDLLARLDAAFARERQFTADVSHELRTPLAGIRMVLEVAALTASDLAAWRAAGDRALAVVAELTRTVERLLALARADAGQLPTALEPIAMRPFVDAQWQPHLAAAAARGLRFHNRLDADTIVTADPALAAIVLGNLLANAVAYTEAGGAIEVRAVPGAIEVVDSGPAIPADHLPHLFDRMWRGDAARSLTAGHAGIGLALARAVATSLGWTLTAANRSDGAVVFAIGMPAIGMADVTRGDPSP